MSTEVHPHTFDPQTEQCRYCHRTRQQIAENPDWKPRFGSFGRYVVGNEDFPVFSVTGTYADLAWIKDMVEAAAKGREYDNSLYAAHAAALSGARK